MKSPNELANSSLEKLIKGKAHNNQALMGNYFGSPPFSEGSGAIRGDYSFDIYTFKAYQLKVHYGCWTRGANDSMI